MKVLASALIAYLRNAPQARSSNRPALSDEPKSNMTCRDKSICYGTYDAEVYDNDYPKHDAKRHLLCLMAKLSLTHQRTGPATQERHQVQSALGHPPPAVAGLPLVEAVCDKANDTHDANHD
jgi:hypothetical protein